MSTIINHVLDMSKYQGQCVNLFGKDSTGHINYQFNQQGFRSNIDFDFIPEYAFFGCSLVFGVGVPENQTFSCLFNRSQNYGLAGSYNNYDIMTVLETFLKSDLYSKKTKIAVMWHHRDAEHLDEYYSKLISHNIIHFFCGARLLYSNCYAMIPSLDKDISLTHMGVKTHRAFGRILLNLFNQ